MKCVKERGAASALQNIVSLPDSMAFHGKKSAGLKKHDMNRLSKL